MARELQLPSTVVIRYDGTDITQYVLPATARFESLMSAAPGSFEITVRDRDQTLDFTTGRELTLEIDDQLLWGGYNFTARRTYAFPVVDTVTRAPSAVKERMWKLTGSDYNVLMDRRVLRNDANPPSSYLRQLPNFDDQTYDGELIEEALVDSKYFDIEDDFDVTSQVDNVVRPFDPENEGSLGEGAWLEQGSPMRAFFEDLAQFSGAVYYFAADKTLFYKALESQVARWGFSDFPNFDGVTAIPAAYQGSTIGPASLDALEDGEVMVNDAFVWGGSEWAGGGGGTVFARETNTDAIDAHYRWQKGEVHFGERGFKLQRGVNARANVIVNGAPGSVGGDPDRGLRFAQWTVTLAWFANDVPQISGVRDHLHAGQIVHIEMQTFEEGGEPLEHVLPLRSLSITFPATKGPNEDDEAETYVRFEGTFGLQLDDPYTLWRFLMRNTRRGVANAIVAFDDGTNPAPYGSIYASTPTPDPDSSQLVFDLPGGRGYIRGTTEVYVTSARQRLGIDYTESDPDAGEIEFTTAPDGSDWIWIVCRTTGT